MAFLDDLIKSAFPLILSGVGSLADSQVAGAELNVDQLRLLYVGRELIETYGDELVASSENTYDDQALDALAAFAKDTLIEAGFSEQDLLIPQRLLR